MTSFGELIPGPKLRKESPDDAGNGQDPALDPTTGPLDLDAGVIYIRRPVRDTGENPRPASD
ncbi:hypothetical protein JOD54_005367 [Actinokineospora baliensis]|uniref:hypothetical protein n=1 Tax=Actinokineospora baliensis TaxID=547056 RepID=UPI00195E4B17|nr:hypothetical protein [Actinokineospora baliensis]MBM7775163.1 hypothetical protein [Actinokineospora baliensis]